MKRIITFAGAGLIGLGTLAACGDKVDREGTKDNIIESVEASGGTVDEGCLDDVFDNYSDDELKDFDDKLSDGEFTDEVSAFMTELGDCVTAAGE